jgi:3-hydroxyisobutyrate dehydrogenase-like beta-hydroxyacid dehydrogenase
LGYDVSLSVREKAESAGVSLLSSPADVATKCHTVFTCVPNAEALNEVLHAESRLLNVEHSGQTIVEMSTLSVKELTAFFSGAESAY